MRENLCTGEIEKNNWNLRKNVKNDTMNRKGGPGTHGHTQGRSAAAVKGAVADYTPLPRAKSGDL